MPDISKIQLDSAVYNIKDETARNNLANYETSNDAEIAQLKLPKNFFRNKKYLLIGDSYADGYTPDGNVTSWQQFFVNMTGLSNTIQKHLGGTGFVNLAQNKNFQSLLEEVADDTNVTNIVVLGGYNDTPYNQNQIYNAINAFIIKANEKFPNADIHIGFVGWSSDSTKIYPLSIICQRYREACGYYMASYLNNIEFSLHNYFSDFSSDGFHPNSKGQVKIGRNLIQALMTGSCNNPTDFTQIGISYDSNIKGTPFGTDLTCTQNNNIVSISLMQQKTISFVTPFNGNNGLTEVEIGTINNGYIVGTQYNLLRTSLQVIVHDSTGYYPCAGNIVIRNGKLYIQFGDIRDDLNGYRVFTNISQLLVSGFSGTYDALYC